MRSVEQDKSYAIVKVVAGESSKSKIGLKVALKKGTPREKL